MKNLTDWQIYKANLYYNQDLQLMLDISQMQIEDSFFAEMEPNMKRALEDMEKLEQGAIANPDENRMVGHYWLRAPILAPSKKLAYEIVETIKSVERFASQIKQGLILSSTRERFTSFILVGMGGSVLGPQLLSDALGVQGEGLQPHFLDNTDPDGIDRKLGELSVSLEETLVIVTSKSGGTRETNNALREIKRIFIRQGLDFPQHAVAITGKDSKLDEQARKDKWLIRFPILEWVGGRTSITSPVGLVPGALQGINIVEFLAGARKCDEYTRNPIIFTNPAALLAISWYHAGISQQRRNMVIIPYKDRLQYLSRYLQQLVMESLGKEKDLNHNIVHQGINVFGNKGSSDQHSYVQQLLDGINDCFVTFVEVLNDERQELFFVENNVTCNDYLRAFLQGTRAALSQKGRPSITLTLEKINAHSLGALIALFERAVGFYAALVNINAYHQPGVELGKKGADKLIELQVSITDYLQQRAGQAFTAQELAENLKLQEEVENIFKILYYLSVDNKRNIKRSAGETLVDSRFFFTH